MSKYISLEEFKPSTITLLALVLLGSFIIFVMGFDQGQIFSILEGEQAYKDLYMHELFHDARHAAGFPCH